MEIKPADNSENDKVPNTRRRHKRRESKKHFGITLGEKLTLLIMFLITIILILIFRLFDGFLPVWIVEHHIQVTGAISLIVVLLIFLFPVAIEVDENPRPLSGPGKNPKGPNLP